MKRSCDYLAARWIVLRGLGFVFFSVFYSYAFQVQGLIGPRGVQPAGEFIAMATRVLPSPERYFRVPTLFWLLGTSASVLNLVVWAGLLASLLLVGNCMPRAMLTVCTLLFVSIVNVSGVFSSYQSDGMLLEAGFLAWFFAPPGFLPGLGATHPPSKLTRFVLLWEWLRIYFESGVVKLLSGDPSWRNLTALDHYYENNPLPTVFGWYVQHLPHAFHAATTLLTLVSELVLVWAAFLPPRVRFRLFLFLSAFQLGIILTANYAFLNYLVLVLGVLLVDDVSMRRLLLCIGRYRIAKLARTSWSALNRASLRGRSIAVDAASRVNASRDSTTAPSRGVQWSSGFQSIRGRANVAEIMRVVVLSTQFYATLVRFPGVGGEGMPLFLTWPAAVFEPFRFANGYGLFAVMTPKRYEIEFQGTTDGQTFVAYPFRYKPQGLQRAPGIFAPYQPRFEWNLWFASLGTIERNRWVLRAAAALARGEPAVLQLFAFDPFRGSRPQAIRTVVYQYWFTDWRTMKQRGLYWHRKQLGAYAPTLHVEADGSIAMEPWQDP